jgi:hypothetical protein
MTVTINQESRNIGHENLPAQFLLMYTVQYMPCFGTALIYITVAFELQKCSYNPLKHAVSGRLLSGICDARHVVPCGLWKIVTFMTGRPSA